METKQVVAIAAAIIVVAVAVGGVGIYFAMNQEEKTYELTIGIANKNGYDPLMYANAEGLFEDEGVKVTVKWDENGGLTTNALIAGQVDMTNAGTTPVINAIHKNTGIVMTASNCFNKPGTIAGVIIGLKTDVDAKNVDLNDLKKTFFDGGDVYNGKQIGLAATSGYFDSWKTFVTWAKTNQSLTDAQVTTLTTLNGAGGAIKDLGEASTGITDLLSVSPSICMVFSGSDVDKVSDYPDKLAYLELPAKYLQDKAPVGGIYIISKKAYEENKEGVLRALKAIKKAAACVQDVSEKGKSSEYYAKLWKAVSDQGAYASEAAMLKQVQSRYWGVFLCADVFDYYNSTEASTPSTHVDGFDLKNSFENEFLKKLYPDGKYVYDRFADEWKAEA